MVIIVFKTTVNINVIIYTIMKLPVVIIFKNIDINPEVRDLFGICMVVWVSEFRKSEQGLKTWADGSHLNLKTIYVLFIKTL